jgi:DNA-binding FadR family transcriptional regulator
MTKNEEIDDVLTEEILSQRFRAGERLPCERDLAARFDINRGAVREAMKLVAQLGRASIQPGGARVEPIEQASLDVIGYMLRRTPDPAPSLVIDIFEALNALVLVAVDRVIRNASEDEMRGIRALLKPLIHDDLDEAAHTIARMEFFRVLMVTSHPIVCQLVARALLEALNRAVVLATLDVGGASVVPTSLHYGRA